MGSEGSASCILHLGTRGEWSASCPGCFTPGPLAPLDRRLGGLQSQSGHGGEKKYPYCCWELNPNHPVHSLATILTEEKKKNGK
jgi:hypothetical protein